jgi:hypothetical protein
MWIGEPADKPQDKALKLQHEIIAMPEPNKYDLHYLQDFFATQDMGPIEMLGPDSNVWGSRLDRRSYSPDLVALHGRQDEDPFSTWVTERGVRLLFHFGCHRFKSPGPGHGMIGYKTSSLLRITYWVTTIVASLLPIASITTLYFVKPMVFKLAIMAGLNVFVSICLLSFTTAKRSEIFAVSAGYVLLSLPWLGVLTLRQWFALVLLLSRQSLSRLALNLSTFLKISGRK